MKTKIKQWSPWLAVYYSLSLDCCVDCWLSHSFDWTCPRQALMGGKKFQSPLYTAKY